MTAQEIKEFCKEQGLTYKQLGELIGMSEGVCKMQLKKIALATKQLKRLSF